MGVRTMMASALVLAEIAAPGAAHAQSRYSNEHFWFAAPANTDSDGVAFGCMTGLEVVADRPNSSRTVSGRIGEAIVMPVLNYQDQLQLLVVPRELIVDRSSIDRRSRDGRSFVAIPNTDLLLETTGNMVTYEDGAIVDRFVENATAGRAVFSLPGYERADGSFEVDVGARALRPRSMGSIAQVLGTPQEVQNDRAVGPGRTYIALAVMACE